MTTAGIYKITCLPTHKIYIGSAIHLNNRKNGHFRYLRNGKHKNRHLQNAFDLYGENNFVFSVLEIVTNLDELLQREQYWMDATDCYNREIGFNICVKAGSSLGVKRTDEFKEKIRQVNLNRDEATKKRVSDAVKKANTGTAPPNKGKKMWEGKTHPRGGLGKKYPDRKMSAEDYEIRKNSGSWLRTAHWIIEPETGCPLKIENLSDFCKKNNLNSGAMYQVVGGKLLHHKGWEREELYYTD